MGLRRKKAHIGIPAKRILAVLFSRLQGRGGVSILINDIGTTIDERLSCGSLLGWIKPGIHP